jgi:hypothetical protein
MVSPAALLHCCDLPTAELAAPVVASAVEAQPPGAPASDRMPKMPPTFDQIKGLIGPFEGNVPHMYVDTKGFVTVGIGNMLPNVKAAQALAFANRTTKNPATGAEIATDFETVAKQPKAKAARWYRQFTALDLPDVEINRLFQNRIQDFRGQLRRA